MVSLVDISIPKKELYFPVEKPDITLVLFFVVLFPGVAKGLLPRAVVI